MSKTVRFENTTVFQGLGQPLLTSITIKDGLVVSTETPADQVIDCEGGAILPAFGDAHAHPLLAARGSLGPKLDDCKSIEAIRQKVSMWAKQNPNSHWIVGGFYDRDLAPEGRFDRRWLDDLDDRPIVLQSADQHAIWVNTKALSISGLSDLADPPFGVDRDSNGILGTLREDAKKFLLERVPPIDPEVMAKAIEGKLDELASLGIVFVLDAWVDEAGLEAYRRVRHPLTVQTAFWVTPETDFSSIADDQSVKLFVDGVIGSATALVREEYECETSHPHGVSSWERDQFDTAVRQLANGVRDVFIHAIGDAAIDWVISAAQGHTRIHIEHAELLTEDQIVAVSKLGITICFQPLWARPDAMMQNAIRNLGSERASRMYPTADLHALGGKFVFGSDWPVSSADPLLGMFTAVHRSEPNSIAAHNPINRIGLEHAITAYTTGCTDSAGDIHSKPVRSARTLKLGDRADFVLLSGNPFANPLTLPELRVVQTFSGGEAIFTRH